MWVRWKLYRFFHLTTRVSRERKVTSALTQSSSSLHSLHGQSLLGAQCPVASQWAVLTVIPAHEADSHHKAPIVFTGWIGSHSACHSAATCITRRHSGACFCFWFLLSCQPHRATLFCLWAYLTLIWEVLPKLPTQLLLDWKSCWLMWKQLWQSSFETVSMGSHVLFVYMGDFFFFVADSKGLHVPESSHGWYIIWKTQNINMPAGLWANRVIEIKVRTEFTVVGRCNRNICALFPSFGIQLFDCLLFWIRGTCSGTRFSLYSPQCLKNQGI